VPTILSLPNLEEKRQAEMETETIRFTDIRKKGPMGNLDKKRTIKENMKRNAAHGDPTFHDIKNEDLRYKTWEPTIRYESNAVVLAMMDISGCLVSGHLIEMSDGSYKDVADIIEGDEVACINLETREKTTSRVVAFLITRPPDMRARVMSNFFSLSSLVLSTRVRCEAGRSARTSS